LTIAEITEQFEVTEQAAKRAKSRTTTRSLDADISQDNRGNLKQMVKNRKAVSPSKSLLEEDKAEKLEEAMSGFLSDRERRIIKLYYGIEDHKQRTLQEVGDVFDLSRERIRQLRDRALKKLSQVNDLQNFSLD